MKNYIFTATALALGVMATAQTQQTVAPVVQQTFPTSTATIGGNYSDIDQIAVGSSAMVQQQGTANASFINQTGANAGNLNTIDVLQWGNVQPSISGHLNYSDIMQNGEGNAYTLDQQGDLNENEGMQVGLDNDAIVKQGADGPQQGEGNLARVDQDGKENFAEVQQRWDNSNASIVQRNDQATGVGNRSYQEQLANPNQSAGHTAFGSQDGDDNEMVQLQEGPGSGNYADIVQGDAGTKAVGAFAQQVQLGEGNEAFATQYLSTDESYQEQIGSDNLAEVKQNTGGISTGGNNLVEQYQDGTDNEARSDQNGNDNTAYQEQYGNDNVSTVFQRYGQLGGNLATSIQSGSFNDSEINQQAHSNTALVDQMGNGQMSVINQNNPITGAAAAVAGNNSATVIQRNANAPLTPQIQRAAAAKRHTF
jgi:hypothetical protein